MIQLSLKGDQSGDGGCNEQSFLVGQRLGQKKLERVVF